MATPHMPHLPGAAVMTDTLDFVKNLWGSMSVPGLTAPTLSVEELDKKINDLKAVEAWLNLNMSMLRGSIQALEVQRGTIATLKSVGASLAAAVKQPPGSEGKSIFDANPYASAFFHHAREAGQQSANTATQPTTNAAPAAPEPASPPPPPEQQAKTPEPAATDSSAMTNPAIWWNMLQDQFKQAVSTAMASESLITSAAAHATDTAAKFAAATSATPAAKSDTKLDTKSATKSATKPAAKSAAKPAAKPTTTSATTSAINSATNSATKPAAKPAARKAAPAKR